MPAARPAGISEESGFSRQLGHTMVTQIEAMEVPQGTPSAVPMRQEALRRRTPGREGQQPETNLNGL